jgi:rhodanese-related sulfurtransferase
MDSAIARIDARELHARLMGETEIALLDVREEGVFGASHILCASNVPTSCFERLVAALVPRRATPVILCDDDETLSERAAVLLAAHGYSSVAILRGGIAAWKSAGLEIFSGVYVPSKAFGEFVEAHYHTPHIDGSDLKRRLEAREDIVLLDSRPFDEYHWISIPGAIDCPGGELVLRGREAVPSPDTLVVVNCGGRTRSIIGAQILIDAGLPNKILSLKDGTQGWHLAGMKIARGQDKVASLPGERAAAWAREAAQRLAARFAVNVIDGAALDRFERETDTHTLYRFDVRDPGEYRAGHRKGFLSAPGGQLVQATDTFIAVRQARIVLADSDGVRARTTASWLVRMGFAHVYVLDEAAPIVDVEYGDAPEHVLGLDRVAVDPIGVDELAKHLGCDAALVVDVGTSRHYRAGHIPGAWFAIRGRFAQDSKRLPSSPLYVLTSPDGVTARLAAAELAEVTGAPVRVLPGGTDAWRAAGHRLETDQERLASRADDVLLKAFERTDDPEAAMREYLQWEVGLVEQVRRDGTVRFRL